MLRPRIIPCLLVSDRGLVKTVRFRQPKYVGDPINAVRIFNEKEADELTILDIDATANRREPDYREIARWAAECRMPLCYGGGIKTVEQAQRIIGLGVEKVALGAAAFENPSLLPEIAATIGSQSVVVVIDVKQHLLGGVYKAYVRNGKSPTGKDPVKWCQELQTLGVGEIVINSIERDGTMKGYDLALAARLRESVTVPLTFLGGAGSLQDMKALYNVGGINGLCAGSMFVFNGPYKAVLISYPSAAEKASLLG